MDITIYCRSTYQQNNIVKDTEKVYLTQSKN